MAPYKFAQLPYGMNIQDIAYFVIGMHQAHYCLFRAASQLLLQVLQVDVARWVIIRHN